MSAERLMDGQIDEKKKEIQRSIVSFCMNNTHQGEPWIHVECVSVCHSDTLPLTVTATYGGEFHGEERRKSHQGAERHVTLHTIRLKRRHFNTKISFCLIKCHVRVRKQ